jgi:hypothetical protein
VTHLTGEFYYENQLGTSLVASFNAPPRWWRQTF